MYEMVTKDRTVNGEYLPGLVAGSSAAVLRPVSTCAAAAGCLPRVVTMTMIPLFVVAFGCREDVVVVH